MAKILGVPLGHVEEAFECGTHCKMPDVVHCLAINPPVITENNAWVNVEGYRRGVDKGRPWMVLEGQVYLLSKQSGAWKVVGLGTHSIS